MDPGFPRQIVEDFPGVDSKVDAVFEAFGKRILILLANGALEIFYGIRRKIIKIFLIIGFLQLGLFPFPKFKFINFNQLYNYFIQ